MLLSLAVFLSNISPGCPETGVFVIILLTDSFLKPDSDSCRKCVFLRRFFFRKDVGCVDPDGTDAEPDADGCE